MISYMSNLKKRMRANPWLLFSLHVYHAIRGKLSRAFISDEKAIRRYYKRRSGRDIDFNNLQTFSEKLQWLKLHDKNPLKAQCADKYEVRQYVESCGLGHLLNEVYGVWSRVGDIDIDSLPAQFVLKATHGSGFNLIVKDKKAVNWTAWKLIMRSWLWQDIYWGGREWVYKDLQHRIIAEKYLEDSFGELRDYKFFCFHGKPEFMQLDTGRGTSHHMRNLYDMDWNLLPFGKHIPHNPNLIVERPALFDEMKAIAERLAQPFEFARVDLYQVYDKLYFGELTFFPYGGAPVCVPAEYDKVVGDMLRLNTVP